MGRFEWKVGVGTTTLLVLRVPFNVFWGGGTQVWLMAGGGSVGYAARGVCAQPF